MHKRRGKSVILFLRDGSSWKNEDSEGNQRQNTTLYEIPQTSSLRKKSNYRLSFKEVLLLILIPKWTGGPEPISGSISLPIHFIPIQLEDASINYL